VTDCNLIYLTGEISGVQSFKIQHLIALLIPLALKSPSKSGHMPVTTIRRKNEELG
jgi:hypothetical protein